MSNLGKSEIQMSDLFKVADFSFWFSPMFQDTPSMLIVYY
jgi:hypothetical protein